MFRYAVALTGGIATGKSTASGFLGEMGFEIIDADTIAHEILDSQHQKIAEMFGSELIKDDKVDRKALGAIVFGDEVQRKRLEELVHPLIQQEIEHRASELDMLREPYLIDIPLFYERAAYPIERVLVVYAPRELQIVRLMERNTLSRTEALQRLDAQMDIEQKRDRAKYLIDNTGTIEQLAHECRRVYDEIISDFGYNSNKNG